jgi:hypothetical protein
MDLQSAGMRATVNQIIHRVFPEGTNQPLIKATSPDEPDRSCTVAPGWPPDTFAVAAFLLERSGVYQLLAPGMTDLWQSPWTTISAADQEKWIKAGRIWHLAPKIPDEVQELWDMLLRDGSKAPLSRFPGFGRPLPEWVYAAIGLMIIADEASEDAGYSSPNSAPKGWVAQTVLKFQHVWLERNIKATAAKHAAGRRPPAPGHLLLTNHNFTMTLMASQDLVAVQPKARTSQLGATLRTMAHNLALLPPPSRMSATWQRHSGADKSQSQRLNLLLIPFPYEIKADWFEGIPEKMKRDKAGNDIGKPWGWFDLNQKWLPKDPGIFVKLVAAMIHRAEKDSSEAVHAVILPEYSLRWEHHEALVSHLCENFPDIEFVVAGSRTNCEGHEGNFALTSSITEASGNRSVHTNSRGKHHRWRLDESQIQTYDLGGSLDPKLLWWEGIALHRRMVHSHVFRNSSCFTTFICEDLARSDPAHETVRALGPNIVFSLLMDNVQIKTRWSARYATGLSEDPGSSVLTFTSRGLIARAASREKESEPLRSAEHRALGDSYARQSNWSVALWKQDGREAIELHCPPGDHAVLLELSPRQAQENTYDGRKEEAAIAWEFYRARSIGLPSTSVEVKNYSKSEKVDASVR